MNPIDVRTVVLCHVVADAVCTLVLVWLWAQKRRRFGGTAYWVADFVLQTAGALLIALRGSVPDWMSVVLANTLVVAGVLVGYIGLTLFLGQRRRQLHNYLLLAAFVAAYCYFTFVHPDLAGSTVTLSLSLLALFGQWTWLWLRQTEPGLRSMAQGPGVVSGIYCLVSVVRIAVVLVNPQPANDFFQSGFYDSLLLLAYLLLLILRAFSLALMVNQRLLNELQTQETKFAQAFRSSPYAFMITRPSDGEILEVNEGFVALTGYPFAEVIGKTTLALKLWAREADRAAVVEALAQGHPVTGREYQYRKKSGEWLTGLFSAELIQVDGQPRIVASISDITNRKQMEEALRASESKFMAIFQTAPMAIVLSRLADGVLVDVNEAFEKLFEYRKEEALGRTSAELGIAPAPQAREQLLAQVQQQGFAHHQELTYRTRSGKPIVLHGNIDQITIGHSQCILNTFEDITERKRAAAEAEEGKRILDALMKYVPEGITVAEGPDATIRLVSQFGQDLLGGPHAQKTAEAVADMWKIFADDGLTPLPTEDLPLVRAIHRGEVVQNQDLVQLNAEGKKLSLSCSAGPIRDAAGNITGAIVAWRDISALKHAEAEIRHLASFPEANPSPVLEMDRQGAVTYANSATAAWLERLGCPDDSRTFLPADIGALRQTMGLGRPAQVYREVTVGRAIFGEDLYWLPQFGVWRIYARDITERKRGEDALRASEARRRLVVQHAPAGIYEIDFPSGFFTEVNDVMCQILGYTREELLAMKGFDLMDADSRALFAARIRRAQSGDKPEEAVEYRVRTKDGRLIWALISASFRWSGKTITGATVVAHDISERKRAEQLVQDQKEQLRAQNEELAMQREELQAQNEELATQQGELIEAREELEVRVQERTVELEDTNAALEEEIEERKRAEDEIRRLNEDLQQALRQEQAMHQQLAQAEKLGALGRMVSSVAHELNNPLQTIRNCLYLTGADLPPESPIHQYLAMASSETQRLVSLVAQLRELYRPRTVAPETHDLVPLLDNVRALMTAQLESGQVQWQQPPELPPYPVRMVPDRIKQVFINVATNAIEAMQPAGGQLEVNATLSADGTQVGVGFKDCGPGIPAENLDRLFEPFFTTKSQGLGLGLPICYEIAQQHGGCITVESQPGRGAVFTLWLPLGQAAEGGPGQPPPGDQPDASL